MLFILASCSPPSLPPSHTQNRQPFVTRDVVLWSELAQALTNFFACGTGRGLTQDNLRFLAYKLIPNLGAFTNRQTDRHTDRQTQSDRQTHRQISGYCACVVSWLVNNTLHTSNLPPLVSSLLHPLLPPSLPLLQALTLTLLSVR